MTKHTDMGGNYNPNETWKVDIKISKPEQFRGSITGGKLAVRYFLEALIDVYLED